MSPTRTTRTCPTCSKYLPSGGPCPRCSASGPQPRRTRAFAKSLRAQTSTQPAPQPAASGGGLWGPITGEVRREQETWTGRARGTTPLALTGLAAPMIVAISTGATTTSEAAGGAFAVLAVLLWPIAFLIILMSLGRGGPLSFMGRLIGNTANLGMGLTSRQRARGGGPGRILILENGANRSRVAVARPLDVPIGSTVTVHGPRIAGYRHAWLIRVHGLDSHALPARGVLPAIVSAAVGGPLAVLMLIAGIGGSVG